MDNDYAQDQKLPFKHIDFTNFSTLVFVVESFNHLKIEAPIQLFIEKRDFSTLQKILFRSFIILFSNHQKI
jgi:hypothetical protein